MNAKFKVGDTVTIKSKYDRGAGPTSYRFIFTEYMLRNYGGQTFKIGKIIDYSVADDSGTYLPDDTCLYLLEGMPHSWALSMFEINSTTEPTIF